MDLGIGEIVKSATTAGPVSALGDTWHALIGDRIAHWRLERAMELQVKTNEEARRLGLKVDRARVPERYAFAWFEEATKQDEPEVQVLFARLLARAAAGDDDAADWRLIGVLSNLTPPDAAIFQRIYSERPFPKTGPYADTPSVEGVFSAGGLKGWPRDWAQALIEHFHPSQAAKSLEHLLLVGILKKELRMEGKNSLGHGVSRRLEDGREIDWRKLIQTHAASREYILSTELGSSLYNAVKE